MRSHVRDRSVSKVDTRQACAIGTKVSDQDYTTYSACYLSPLSLSLFSLRNEGCLASVANDRR